MPWIAARAVIGATRAHRAALREFARGGRRVRGDRTAGIGVIVIETVQRGQPAHVRQPRTRSAAGLLRLVLAGLLTAAGVLRVVLGAVALRLVRFALAIFPCAAANAFPVSDLEMRRRLDRL